ncbi:hypothetical protein B0H10DRAFT_2129190 [Mycena sp. CBHHK59/15]|nr:hypothetical protein B0H10DRAFT_2129190 [Mycena sp. CBHHK59/15]
MAVHIPALVGRLELLLGVLVVRFVEGQQPGAPADRSLEGRDGGEQRAEGVGERRGEGGGEAQRDGAADARRHERAAEGPVRHGERRREVQEGVQGVEEPVGVREDGKERDLQMCEDRDEGGVRPARAVLERNGGGEGGTAGAGPVDGEDLDVVLARDAFDHSDDEAVAAKAVEEDERRPCGVRWCLCQGICHSKYGSRLRAGYLEFKGIVEAREGEILCGVCIESGRNLGCNHAG